MSFNHIFFFFFATFGVPLTALQSWHWCFSLPGLWACAEWSKLVLVHGLHLCECTAGQLKSNSIQIFRGDAASVKFMSGWVLFNVEILPSVVIWWCCRVELLWWWSGPVILPFVLFFLWPFTKKMLWMEEGLMHVRISPLSNQWMSCLLWKCVLWIK